MPKSNDTDFEMLALIWIGVYINSLLADIYASAYAYDFFQASRYGTAEKV